VQERLAAEEVLAAFCKGNPTGQAQLASTLQPSSKAGTVKSAAAAHSAAASELLTCSGSLFSAAGDLWFLMVVAGPSFGAELLSALAQGASAGSGTARPAAAARILAHLLADCAPAKGHALSAQPPTAQQHDGGDATPTALLTTCCMQAAAAAAAGSPAAAAATALHSLLVIWCHAFEPAATALAAQTAHLHVLSEVVAGRSVICEDQCVPGSIVRATWLKRQF
jgi:hypothetical protein